MKKILTALAIGAAFAATPASAQWYVGAGVGTAKGTGSGTAGAAQYSANSSRQTSGKIYGGYQFTQNWGIEAQYTDLGRYNYTLTSGAASDTGSAKAKQWGIAGTGTLPLSNNFYLMAKLGLSANRVSLTPTSVTSGGVTTTVGGNGSKTDLLAGIGAGYNFDKNIGLRVEYENFGKMANITNGGTIKGDNFSVSLRYSF